MHWQSQLHEEPIAHLKGKCLSKKEAKKCVDCSTSQQIKCFGIEEVDRGISKNRKCNKTSPK